MQDSTPKSFTNPPRAVAGAILALAVILTLVLYGKNLGSFYILDSVDVLGNNAGLQFDATEFDRWRVAALSSDRGLFGRPLSNLSFALDARLAGGADARWMKMSNALLHVIMGLMAWRIFALALAASPVLRAGDVRAQWVSAIAVAIWLVHPLHVSTVLYAVQRMAQLSTLFVLAGLWFFTVRRIRWLDQAPTAMDYSSTLLGMTVCMLLATVSKGNGVLLPLYAAVMELCLFRGQVAGGRAKLPWRLSQLALLVPALAVLVLLALQPAWLVDMYSERDFNLLERSLTQLRVLWEYLSWTLLPRLDAFGVFHDDAVLSTSLLSPSTTLVSLLAWIGVGLLALVLRNRFPMLALALLWYLAGHSMESSIIALELVFEHRNYLPVMGPLLLVAWVLTSAPVARFGLATVAALGILVALGILLNTRASYWSTELGLAQTQYQHHPDSRRSLLHLANVHVHEIGRNADPRLQQEHYSAARLLHWQMIQADRNYIPSLFALIQLESVAGRKEEVQRLYEQLVIALGKPGVTPTELSSLQQLVTCMNSGACIPPAGGPKAYLERVLQQQDSTATRELLMRQCLETGDHACVREHAEVVIASEPDYVYSYLALYLSSVAAGDKDGALTVAQRMLKADPLRRQLFGIRDSLEAAR